MLPYARVVLGVLAVSACTPAVGWGQDAKPKVKVELRWVETKPVKDVTEEKGFQASCDPKDIVYPHKKPALVLTAAEVSKVTTSVLDLSKTGMLAENTMVNIHLTKAAREKLAATTEGKRMKLLTVVVDGKSWGVHRYEKDKDKQFVPDQARAETFTPGVGYFSSKAEAQRLVDALK